MCILQVEDLRKVEGMTEKRFSSFMKVCSKMNIYLLTCNNVYTHYIVFVLFRRTS